MTTPLEPDIEAYGTYARACALADWVELAALKGIRITRDDLADIVADNNWSRKPVRHYFTRDDFDDEESTQSWHEDELDDLDDSDDPETHARAAFRMLRERRITLGVNYPFALTKGAWRSDGASYTPYLSLLAISVAHAWPQFNLTGPQSPENVLEHLVADRLQHLGLLVARMGALDRSSHDFLSTLATGGAQVGLQPARPATYPLRAKDDGVDTLSALPWRDRRRGRWSFIGQATCAKSDEWEAKLARPKPHIWKKYLLVDVPPLVFLAVPHHIDQPHLLRLLDAEQGILIDRLRLADHPHGVTKEERDIIDMVLAAPVSTGAAARVKVA